MTRNPARVGFVGVGGRGSSQASTVEATEHEIVAGADVSEEMRDGFAAEYDVPVYEDHEAMYDDVALDAVIVSTPNKFHEPATVAALERDLPVLVEKPLAHSLESAERIRAADRDSSAFCMVGFQRRFAAAVELFTALRDEGRFGTLRHVDATYRRRRGIPGLGSWFTNEALSGGGALIDLGVHVIDLALYLLDFPEIQSVQGVTRGDFGSDPEYADPSGWSDNWSTEEGGFDVEDEALAFVRTTDGTSLSFDVAWATNAETDHGIEVRGSEAGATLGLGGTDLTVLDAGTAGVDHYEDAELSGRDRDAAREQLTTFLDGALAGDRPAMNTVDQGVAVQRVIDAIYRSSERDEPVTLSD